MLCFYTVLAGSDLLCHVIILCYDGFVLTMLYHPTNSTEYLFRPEIKMKNRTSPSSDGCAWNVR